MGNSGGSAAAIAHQEHELRGRPRGGRSSRGYPRAASPPRSYSFWPLSATFVADSGQKEISRGGGAAPSPHRVSRRIERRSMESRVKVLGHGTHPILVALPIGLLSSALGFDLLRLLTGDKKWSQIAYWNMLAGCVSGWVSMLPGAIDWWFLPRGTRAKRVGLIHAIIGDTTINLFFASCLLRRKDPENPAPRALALAALGGMALGAV